MIHGGLLARRDSPDHMAELNQHGIGAIDVVVVNLYPFVETVSKAGVTLDDALENIDIGGPTMLRAAAKNFPSVAVVVDPSDYEWVADALAGDGLNPQQRRSLATKAFQHVAVYDAAVAGYLAADPAAEDEMPEQVTIGLARVSSLRYGENPHQRGALYVPASGGSGGLARAKQLHGRELSFNNLMDADAAWRTVSDYGEPAACVIKHANPCGLASRDDLAEAYRLAYEGDPVSAFGGIVGFNRTVTAEAADAMGPVFYEVVVAPGYDGDALEILQRKRNLRILSVDTAVPSGGATDYDVRPLSGGMLVQTPDAIKEDPGEWTTATERAPTASELADLAFAWKAVKHIKSNAIAFVKDRKLVGMGAGQPNRVVSVHLSQRRPVTRPPVACWPRMRSSRSPTTSNWPRKQGLPPSCNPAGQSGTTKLSLPPTTPASLWYSPASGISATDQFRRHSGKRTSPRTLAKNVTPYPGKERHPVPWQRTSPRTLAKNVTPYPGKERHPVP